MKELRFFKTKIEDCANTKIDISDNLNPNKRDYSKLSKFGLGCEPKEFNLVTKMISSHEDFMKLMQKFVTMCKFYKYLGKDKEIRDFLKEAGIEILIGDIQLENPDTMNKKKFSKLWKMISHTPEKSNKELLEYLVSNSVETLDKIQEYQDEIKDTVEDMQTKCELDKPVINTSLTYKTKKLQGKNPNDIVDNLETKVVQLNEAIKVMENDSSV